ncbi:GGDEF domain-containing protein [Sphingobium bisphenolivorans]|uniref:GGDEF domain-containing protein n=1 Tax=Sphingobium bisphenolivorans TaxID=1335760 RepID=UPI00039B1F83|nr:GGDEF domain-containing protein [Sphingobium bisphenolivorans]
MHLDFASSADLARPLRLRLLALCCLASHLPLLFYMGWGLATGRVASAEIIILLLGSWAGAAILLRGIAALMNRSDNEERHQGLFAVMRQIVARRDRMSEPVSLPLEDALTGLPNRRGFLARLDALPAEQRQGCIALVAVDRLADHALDGGAGDTLLQAFGHRLSSRIRRIDLIARWDSEEFAIFYPDAIEDEASWSLARIAAQLRHEPLTATDGEPLTFSAGLCRWRGEPIAAAIYKAKAALANASNSGGDQVQRAGSASLRVSARF